MISDEERLRRRRIAYANRSGEVVRKRKEYLKAAQPLNNERKRAAYKMRCKEPVKRICLECQTEFIPNTLRQRYCNSKCRDRFHNKLGRRGKTNET